SMDILYLDLINLIFNKLDFLSQIRFRQISQFYYKHLQITDLYHIDYKYLKLLNDEILKNYLHVKYLNANDNSRIKEIGHMKNLEILNCKANCGIANEDIKDLNLKILE